MADFIKIPEKTLYTACDDKRVKVVVGGVNTEYFAPSVNMSFKLESPSEKYFLNICDDVDQVKTESKSESIDGDLLKIKDGQVESCFKNIDGGIKIERVFDVKPTSAPRYKLAFSQGVRFCYQPELTPEEIADGHIRPDNVVGSYAIYCDKVGHYKDKSGNTTVNYGSGKIGHLYAPYWTDSGGKKIKGSQEIVGNILTFDLPDEQWLDEAVYPITLDPDVGFTTAGGSLSSFNTNATGIFSAGSNGSATAVFVALNGTGAMVTAGVYNDNSSYPGDLLRDSGDVASANGFVECTLDTPLSINTGTNYWVCSRRSGLSIRYDSLAGKYAKYSTTTYSAGSLPDPWPSGQSSAANTVYSMYFAYTESGGSTLLPIPKCSLLYYGKPLGINAETLLGIISSSLLYSGGTLGVNAETLVSIPAASITFGGQFLGVNEVVIIPASSILYSGKPLDSISGSVVTINVSSIILSGQELKINETIIIQNASLLYKGKGVTVIDGTIPIGGGKRKWVTIYAKRR